MNRRLLWVIAGPFGGADCHGCGDPALEPRPDAQEHDVGALEQE